jgi:hypothetical protein
VIPAGQVSKTFVVTLNGDTFVEGNETVRANLSAVTGATVLDSQGLGTILNDDGPTLSIANVSTTEGNAGTKLLTFTVSLSQVAGVPVTFDIASSNGSATAGTDFDAVALTGQSIAAGQLTKTIDVTIKGDTTVEGNETFAMNLANSVGASIMVARSVGTITNDD